LSPAGTEKKLNVKTRGTGQAKDTDKQWSGIILSLEQMRIHTDAPNGSNEYIPFHNPSNFRTPQAMHLTSGVNMYIANENRYAEIGTILSVQL